MAEEHRVPGENLVRKIKEIVREGNVRRIAIRNEDGKELIEVPLSIGLVGTLMLPAWAAIGAIAALVTNCSIVVERDEPEWETRPAPASTDSEDYIVPWTPPQPQRDTGPKCIQ